MNCCISLLKEVRYVSEVSQQMLFLQLSKQQYQGFAEQLEPKKMWIYPSAVWLNRQTQ